MVPIGVIINASGKIAKFFGLIEGVSTQVTKLVHQAFKSAQDNLEYAKTASGQNQIDYIKRAKDLFIDAVAVEENENKVLALVGLSMCQFLLGDTINAEKSFERIESVELTTAKKTKYAAFEYLTFSFLLSAGLPDFSSLDSRKKIFLDTKNKEIATNRELLL